jgi:hypothetical protein
MLLLTAVNTVLRKLGEIDVPSLDEPYPTLAVVLPALEESRQNVLKEGWWFNTMFEWDATPDVNGHVLLPASTLMFYPEDPKYTFDGVQVVLTTNQDPTINATVRGKLIVDKEFERLPYSCAMAITYRAAFDTYISDIGPDDTSKSIEATLMEFLISLGAEHTRSRKQNSRTKKNYLRWRRSLYT